MRRRVFLLFGLPAVLLLVGGVAVASIPDASGVIHGCRKNTDGSLKVIDSDLGQTCGNGYTALNWEKGPRTGTPYGIHVVRITQTVPADGLQHVFAAGCSASEVALSYSGYVNDTPGFTQGVRDALPAHNYGPSDPDGPPSAGYGSIYVTGPPSGQQNGVLFSEVVCAKLVP